MSTIKEDKKVSEMTAGELKTLIRNTVHEVIDPDYGLELKREVEDTLRKSVKSKKRTSVEKVAEDLKLKWQ